MEIYPINNGEYDICFCGEPICTLRPGDKFKASYKMRFRNKITVRTLRFKTLMYSGMVPMLIIDRVYLLGIPLACNLCLEFKRVEYIINKTRR